MSKVKQDKYKLFIPSKSQKFNKKSKKKLKSIKKYDIYDNIRNEVRGDWKKMLL